MKSPALYLALSCAVRSVESSPVSSLDSIARFSLYMQGACGSETVLTGRLIAGKKALRIQWEDMSLLTCGTLLIVPIFYVSRPPQACGPVLMQAPKNILTNNTTESTDDVKLRAIAYLLYGKISKVWGDFTLRVCADIVFCFRTTICAA